MFKEEGTSVEDMSVIRLVLGKMSSLVMYYVDVMPVNLPRIHKYDR